MKIYLKKYAKINIARWCPCCDQNWVVIVKDTTDGKLYCRCEETEILWETPEDIEPNGIDMFAIRTYAITTLYMPV